jgi:hypothetical protein
MVLQPLQGHRFNSEHEKDDGTVFPVTLQISAFAALNVAFGVTFFAHFQVTVSKGSIFPVSIPALSLGRYFGIGLDKWFFVSARLIALITSYYL